MIVGTFPLSIADKLERLIRFAFGPVFGRALVGTFHRTLAAAGPVTLIHDEFTGADGTALTSHAIAPTNTPATSWTAVSGTWQIQSNTAQLVSTDPNATKSATVDAGVADAVVSVDMTIPAAGSFAAGIIARSQGAAYWECFYWNLARSQLVLRESGGTVRASANVTLTGTETMEVTLDGASITIAMGGETINYLSASANQTVEVHGLLTYRSTVGYNVVPLDNFKVVG